MFDSTLNPLWQRYILAVQEEVKPALGCTEPISLALAAAVAAAELEGPVERVEAWVSPNLMKNGLGAMKRKTLTWKKEFWTQLESFLKTVMKKA